MSRSFFERQSRKLKDLATGRNQQKNAPGGVQGSGAADGGAMPTDAPAPVYMRIYDDTDVCRLLGLRKRIVVAARKEHRRGQDWAVEGEHAGMTGRWILEKKPDADLGALVPVGRQDGITTVKIIGRCQNSQVLIARKVCNGERVMVRVRNGSRHFVGDEMDTRLIGQMLQFQESLNPEGY